MPKALHAQAIADDVDGASRCRWVRSKGGAEGFRLDLGSVDEASAEPPRRLRRIFRAAHHMAARVSDAQAIADDIGGASMSRSMLSKEGAEGFQEHPWSMDEASAEPRRSRRFLAAAQHDQET